MASQTTREQIQHRLTMSTRVDDLRRLILKKFKDIPHPYSSTECLNIPEVTALAMDIWDGRSKAECGSKVSDVLGYLWKTGKLDRRLLAHKVNRSEAANVKWAYCLPGDFPDYAGVPSPNNPNRAKLPFDIREMPEEIVLDFKWCTMTLKMKATPDP